VRKRTSDSNTSTTADDSQPASSRYEGAAIASPESASTACTLSSSVFSSSHYDFLLWHGQLMMDHPGAYPWRMNNSFAAQQLSPSALRKTRSPTPNQPRVTSSITSILPRLCKPQASCFRPKISRPDQVFFHFQQLLTQVASATIKPQDSGRRQFQSTHSHSTVRGLAFYFNTSPRHKK
jgi:hypothetical protein